VSQELNEQHEPFLVFRKGHQCPNKLFVTSFKYLGRVLMLAGDRALAEARSCVEGRLLQTDTKAHKIMSNNQYDSVTCGTSYSSIN